MARGENPGREHKNSWDHPTAGESSTRRGGSFAAYRSARPCWKDPAFDVFGETRIFLLHARRATNGTVSVENAHPFSLDVAGRTWFFCHNGTVHDPLPTPAGSGVAATTDSYRLFFRLAGESLGTDTSAALRSVYGSLADYTSLNTFLLEEQELWAVCRWAKDAAYYTLYQSEADGGPVGLVGAAPGARRSVDGMGQWICASG